MNSINVIGNLGADPESRQVGESTVCKFRVAVKRPFAKDATDWFTVKAWGKTGEFVQQYLKKGAKVAITGKMINETYQDKDGNNRDMWVIKADTVDGLDPKPQGGGGNSGGGKQGGDDEIPF